MYTDSTVQLGVQKISIIDINGSILIIKFAVERHDKNKHFQRKKKYEKNVVKNLGWAVKKWPERHLQYFSFFGKNWIQSIETKKTAKGQVNGIKRRKN